MQNQTKIAGLILVGLLLVFVISNKFLASGLSRSDEQLPVPGTSVAQESPGAVEGAPSEGAAQKSREETAAAGGREGEPGESSSGTQGDREDKPLPKMLELGSVGCARCEYMAPITEALKRELAGKVVVEFHDVRESPAIAEQYNIMTIPTQIFLDAKGEEVFRHIGVFEKEEILAKMRELGWVE